MEISQDTVSKHEIKKVLKISVLILLFFIFALLIFEYIRITPTNVRFTNVTSSSVTVSWSTRGKSSASVIAVKKDNLVPIILLPINKDIYYDSRDIEKAEIESIETIEQRIDDRDDKLSSDDFEKDIKVSKREKYTTHHVKVKNLDPNTEYSFLVGDSILYKKVKQSSGENTISTTAVEENLKTPFPTYGAVLNADNKVDVSISELPPVTDGVVYLNLIDKDSNNRSNLFSASINSKGKWYIDISKAIDKEGNPFLDTYSLPGVNLYYELELDAGELGRWKTMDFASALSPSQPFVINTPDTIQDIEIPGSVVKLSNNVLGTFVPSSFAADGDCAFSKYCVFVIEKNGDYETINQSNASDCNNYDYINSTMIARKCAGAPQTPEQENTNLTCGGGKKVGDVGYNNKACYICEKKNQNGNDIAQWVKTSNYVVNGFKCIKKDDENKIEETNGDGKRTTMTVSGTCNDYDGCVCNSKNIAYNAKCTVPLENPNTEDGKKTRMYAIGACQDKDGCMCNGHAIEYKDSCGKNIALGESCWLQAGCFCEESNKTIPQTTYCTDAKRPIMINTATCHDYDGCICNSEVIPDNALCLMNTKKCNSTLSQGDPCVISKDSPLMGTWTIYSDNSCVCLGPDLVVNAKCYEGIASTDLIYIEDNQVLSCQNGKMKPIVKEFWHVGCVENLSCDDINSRRCLMNDRITILYCNKGKWTEVSEAEQGMYFIYAYPIEKIDSGIQCNNEYCICKKGTDHRISKSEFCIEVNSCSFFNEGKICNKQGNTCINKMIDGNTVSECSGGVKSSMATPTSKLLSNSIVPKAFAQASETEEYIIDSSTGLISGIASGIYTFELDGITYMFFVDEEALGANNGKILIFIDKDGNGIYDEGTDTKVSELASKIAISTIQKEYSYKLKQGFNFVSFPFLNVTESARTALGLLEMLNTLTNGSVYSIAKFDSSWEIVGKNGDTYLSNDFQLIPGQGYVIKVIKDVEISIQGYPIKFESDEDSAPITLFTGWNLIGVYGTKAKVYTAKTLLQDINSFEGVDFTADIVNGWDQDAQSYEGFVLENTNGIESEYGFDFPINTLKSYFVRVADGKGNWQPSLAE